MDIETQAEASTHPDLPEEQAYLDRAYESLEDGRCASAGSTGWTATCTPSGGRGAHLPQEAPARR
jgi:hypothetical protein